MKTSISVLLVCIALSCLGADEPDHTDNPDPFTLALRGTFNYGPIDGFLQTPAGGRPGTSSHQRPKLDELGIDDVAFYDAGLNLQWRKVRFYGGYQFIRLDGSATLSQPLVTHGALFAAGDPVSTDNRLDWFRAGTGWEFTLLDHHLELIPKAEIAFFDFRYRLSDPSQSTERSYIKGCARMGIEGTYHLTKIVSFTLDGAASLPLSNTPQIATVAGTVNFDLVPRSHRFKPRLFAGVGMEWIDYEDNQTLPNHTHANIGPFLSTGLNLSF